MNEATDVVYMRRNQWEMMTIYAKCAKWWLRTVGEVCAFMTLSRSVLHFLQYKKFCEIVMAVKCNEFGLSSEAAKGYLVGSV